MIVRLMVATKWDIDTHSLTVSSCSFDPDASTFDTPSGESSGVEGC
jgi:hypothetical protein